jgi:hypothetical protein
MIMHHSRTWRQIAATFISRYLRHLLAQCNGEFLSFVFFLSYLFITRQQRHIFSKSHKSRDTLNCYANIMLDIVWGHRYWMSQVVCVRNMVCRIAERTENSSFLQQDTEDYAWNVREDGENCIRRSA